MSEEKKVNCYVREYGFFRNTHTCSNPDVKEKEFKSNISKVQCIREVCSATGEIAMCEQCEYYGNRKEFISKKTGEVQLLHNNGDIKDISESKFESLMQDGPIM